MRCTGEIAPKVVGVLERTTLDYRASALDVQTVSGQHVEEEVEAELVHRTLRLEAEPFQDGSHGDVRRDRRHVQSSGSLVLERHPTNSRTASVPNPLPRSAGSSIATPTSNAPGGSRRPGGTYVWTSPIFRPSTSIARSTAPSCMIPERSNRAISASRSGMTG